MKIPLEELVMALLDRRADERRRGNLWRCWVCREWMTRRSRCPSSPSWDHRSWCNASETWENPRKRKRETSDETLEDSSNFLSRFLISPYKLIRNLFKRKNGSGKTNNSKISILQNLNINSDNIVYFYRGFLVKKNQ